MAATMSEYSDHTAAHPSQQKSWIQTLGLDEMQIDRFDGVLRLMDLKAIPTYASNVRQFGHHDTNIISSEVFRDSGSVPCKMVDLPLCGSYHIVFTLEFDDGIKWMLKISANGHRFDSVASAALTSEARTMQFIKAETTIPVPTVYAFEASSDNELNVPFILMERIDGQPLYRKWFDDEIPKASLEHFRINALQSLAEAMAQLNKFTLTRGGALEFDMSGKPIGLRGAKVVDAVAVWNRGTASEDQSKANQDNADQHKQNDGQGSSHRNDAKMDTDKQNTNQGEKDSSVKSEQGIKNDEGEDEDIICEKGPFNCPKSAFLFNLDRPNAYSESSEYVKGCYKALRMFIDLAFSNYNYSGRRFVLTHPDLDVQNILVAEDGTLRGLIDWDGVASVPREIGCAQYPLWLMRDWVPFFYLYDIRERATEEDAGYEESSPAELASYRAFYAHFMQKEIERQTGGSGQVTAFGTLPKQEAQLTRRSLVMRDLDLAASTPFLLTNILCHILHEIESVTEPKWRYLSLDIYSDSSSSSEEAVDCDFHDNSGIDSDADREDPKRESNEVGDDVSDSMAAANLYQQELTKAADSSSRQSQLDQGSQISSKACQMEAQKIEMELPSETGLGSDCPSKPARLGWGRKLLCIGCNAAERGLRRIAKIGHVLEDAVDDVVEVLAEVEIDCAEENELLEVKDPALGYRQPGRVEASEAPEPERPEDRFSTQGTVEPEQSRDFSTIRVTEKFSSTRSTQDTMLLSLTNETYGIASVLPKVEMQDILARKAELRELEKAKNKADHRANKAAIKEELKVWEHIAIAVRVRGVTLEQLQMNQGEIARWVADTLQPEEKHEDDVVPDSGLSRAVEAGGERFIQREEEPKGVQLKEDVKKVAGPNTDVQSAVSKDSTANSPKSKPPKSKNRKGLLGRPAVTAISVPASLRTEEDEPKSPTTRSFAQQSQASSCLIRNSLTSKQKGICKGKNKTVAAKEGRVSSDLENNHRSLSNGPAPNCTVGDTVSANQSGVPSKGDRSADELVLQRQTMNRDEKAVTATTKPNLTPSSQFQSTTEDKFQSQTTPGSLKALCSFEASRLKKPFSNPSKPENDRGSVFPDNSMDGNDNADGEKSVTGGSCKSTNTSVNGDEVELGEVAKAKEEKCEVFGTSVILAAGIERGRNVNDGVCEGLVANEATKTSSHDLSILSGDLGKKNGCSTPCQRKRICNSCSGKSVGSSGMKEVTTARHTARSTDDTGAADNKSPADSEQGFGTNSDKNADLAPGDHHHSHASVHGGDIEDNAEPFEDDGEFRSNNIFHLLGMDRLDELRLLRMQEGFLKLLERY